MAVEEKAVDRASTLTTALFNSSARSLASFAFIALPVFPYFAASSRMGELSPTPITYVIKSWMPTMVESVVFRSLDARKLATCASVLGEAFPWSVPQSVQPMPFCRRRYGTLLSPYGSPSVISTTALSWQGMQSGLFPPVGAVNADLIHCVPLIRFPF